MDGCRRQTRQLREQRNAQVFHTAAQRRRPHLRVSSAPPCVTLNPSKQRTRPRGAAARRQSASSVRQAHATRGSLLSHTQASALGPARRAGASLLHRLAQAADGGAAGDRGRRVERVRAAGLLLAAVLAVPDADRLALDGELAAKVAQVLRVLRHFLQQARGAAEPSAPRLRRYTRDATKARALASCGAARQPPERLATLDCGVWRADARACFLICLRSDAP